MNDGIRVFLGAEMEKTVKREADAEHLSPGAYISMLVNEALADKKMEDFDEAPEEISTSTVGDCYIKLSGEDAQALKQKAAEMGITPTGYVRRIVHTKEYANIVVPTDDLREYIDKFTKLENAFISVVGYIKSAEGVIFQQDLDLLNDYMGQMTDLFKEQVKLTAATRLKTENRMIKFVKDQIKQNK